MFLCLGSTCVMYVRRVSKCSLSFSPPFTHPSTRPLPPSPPPPAWRSARLLRVHASLADADVAEFKAGVLQSAGIAALVTEDEARAWAIAAEDKE